MLKVGIQSTFSTNWNSGVVGSKPSHRKTDSTNTIVEVHSAMLRALWATVSSSPRVARMKAAPTSGRKVTSERIGKPFIASPRRPQQIPGDQQHDADQHRERV